MPVEESVRNAAHNLALQAELLRICERLTRVGIRSVVLKGVPLLRRLGLPLTERALIDNDVLVRRMDVARAVEVLSDMGYRPYANHDLELDLRTGFHHVMLRAGSEGSFCVELHWHAFAPLCFRVPEHLVWAHLEAQDVVGSRIEVLDRPMTIVHTAAHFAQHAFAEARILRTLGAEWSAWRPVPGLAVLARRTGTLAALDYALGAAAELGFTEEAPDLGSSRAGLVRRLLPPARLMDVRPPHDYERAAISLLLLAPRSAGRQVLQTLAPPPSLMRSITGESRPLRVAAQYAWRPTRAVGRCVAHRVWRRSS